MQANPYVEIHPGIGFCWARHDTDPPNIASCATRAESVAAQVACGYPGKIEDSFNQPIRECMLKRGLFPLLAPGDPGVGGVRGCANSQPIENCPLTGT